MGTALIFTGEPFAHITRGGDVFAREKMAGRLSRWPISVAISGYHLRRPLSGSPRNLLWG
jgi:hypothetical protein